MWGKKKDDDEEKRVTMCWCNGGKIQTIYKILKKVRKKPSN